MTWATTAQFLGLNQTLILGSPTADNTMTVTNPINLNGATRSVATIRRFRSLNGRRGGGSR